MDQTDGTWVIESNLPPLMVLSVQSTETLEITVTKTLVSCINTLMASFEDITSSTPRVSNFLSLLYFFIRNTHVKNTHFTSYRAYCSEIRLA